MARTSLAALANTAAKFVLKVDIDDVTTAIDADTAGQSGMDGIVSVNGAIGPELDWRNGLAAWEPFQISILNDFDSVAGTATDNSFERFNDLRSWEDISSTFFVSHVLNASTGTSVVSIGAGTSWPVSTFVQVFEGYLRDAAQGDYGPLVLTLGPSREITLGKTFLNTLFNEKSGLNWDTRTSPNDREKNEAQRGTAVPILYGSLTYAETIAPHVTPTPDLATFGHGLVLTASDERFFHTKPNDPQLYIPDSNGEPLSVEMEDHDGDTQYEWISLDIDRINSRTTPYGPVIGFTDNTGPTGTGRARDGFLCVRSQIRITSVGFDSDWTTTDDVQLDADDTTSVSNTLTGTTNANVLLYTAATDPHNRGFYRVFPRWKSTTNTATTYSVSVRETPTPGTLQSATSGSPTSSTASWNNWTAGTGLEVQLDNNTSTGFDSSSEGLTVVLRPNSLSASDTISVFGGVVDMWTEVPWEQYTKRLYMTADGIDDSLYQYDSANRPNNPAEIFAHFVEQVLGGSVDTTAAAAASSDMDTDGVRLDFQLTDAEETGQDVLEKIATQGMSWIVPNDDGEEVIIYRPTLSGTDAAAESPFNAENIIKGSMRWGLTPREDVARGCIVNYAWNALRRRYDKRMVIAPTAGPHVTNVTGSPTVYTAFVDDIHDTNARPLVVNADLVQDDTTAERLCKWLTLLHGRRRQLVEFETFAEHADITAGDVIYIDRPQVRTYASGDGLTWLGTIDSMVSNSTTFEPSGDSLYEGFGAAHHNDLLVIESGAQAGTYRMNWTGSVWDLSGHSTFAALTTTTAINEPWRVIPGFDVLAAQLIYQPGAGPKVRIRAVEHPVFLPRAADL